jgi:hypothetical protein
MTAEPRRLEAWGYTNKDRLRGLKFWKAAYAALVRIAAPTLKGCWRQNWDAPVIKQIYCILILLIRYNQKLLRSHTAVSDNIGGDAKL